MGRIRWLDSYFEFDLIKFYLKAALLLGLNLVLTWTFTTPPLQFFMPSPFLPLTSKPLPYPKVLDIPSGRLEVLRFVRSTWKNKKAAIKHWSESCQRSDSRLIQELTDSSRSRRIKDGDSVLVWVRVDICKNRTRAWLRSESWIYELSDCGVFLSVQDDVIILIFWFKLFIYFFNLNIWLIWIWLWLESDFD